LVNRPIYLLSVIINTRRVFFLGLYDTILLAPTLAILQKYLPLSCFKRLKKYVTCNTKFQRASISWKYVKSQLLKINTQQCEKELSNLYSNLPITDDSVTIFHICNNHKIDKTTEPSIENTAQMVYKFVTHIYQRNILASVIKYILLKDLLTKFDTYLVNKGIFRILKNRIQQIIFQCILTAFNGSNYDNYLICNYLIAIQSKLNEKIKIQKKGASISTIFMRFTKNLHNLPKITQYVNKTKPTKKSLLTQWPLYLYIKDVRNLVAANLSLDKLGKLFNLPVSKLCFPYNQATSVKQLKSLKSLQPYNEKFWKNSFSNQEISVEDRITAEAMFQQHQFLNLYEYSIYYLKQDCLLLHSIVLTLFNNYLLHEKIDIFLRRNFSQSSLSYEQFFIIEPSKQIDTKLAPKKIKNKFYNYFIKQAVTGGFCTSFVHGHINNNTIINEHLNYLDRPCVDPYVWPNIYSIINWNKSFTELPAGISTIDIRSLYPSAALKQIPVGEPIFYSRFVLDDHKIIAKKNLKTLNLQSFCHSSQLYGNNETDMFSLVSSSPKHYYEYYALELYLNSLPTNIQILRYQSKFTAFGQMYIDEYPVDGFLSYRDLTNNIICINIIQYNSVLYHGHKKTCAILNSKEQWVLADKTAQIKTNILNKLEKAKHHFKLDINIKYVEISDCDFVFHKLPLGNSYMFPFKKHYNYKTFMNNILNNTLTGFLVVKNLELRKQAINPMFGFIIQKTDYNFDKLSPYTQANLQYFNKTMRVVGLHKSHNFVIISTHYFCWLYKTFGFETTPEIYHGLFFKTNYYLRTNITNRLIERKQLKNLIKNETRTEVKLQYEIQSELIKLMLNSCYGFTLCNVTSSKFKSFELRKRITKTLLSKSNTIIKFNENTFLIEKKNSEELFQTLLGHVGCSILFYSKIILLKRLYFLLKYLDPRKAQLLYMDTDSAHFLLKHKNFVDNVDIKFQNTFTFLYDKHFESGSKISGIWVEEGFYSCGQYLGEKCYKLTNNNQILIHMKGLNTYFQNQYHKNNIDVSKLPVIVYNIFTKTSDFIILKSYQSKDLFSNFIPIKRYFVHDSGSFPLKL
jgi:hypothetical protein